jgi:hypothetical protein
MIIIRRTRRVRESIHLIENSLNCRISVNGHISSAETGLTTIDISNHELDSCVRRQLFEVSYQNTCGSKIGVTAVSPMR